MDSRGKTNDPERLLRLRTTSTTAIVVVFFACCVASTFSYNVDTVNFIRHTQPNGTMFGFSVAAHRESGYSWVLVGAPKGQSYRQSLNGVTRGGVVFKCETTANDSCAEVEFNTEGDNRRNGVPIDQKSEQWFGATLQSAGTNGPVVACAPRYVWFTKSSNKRRDPVGTCFVARNNFQHVEEYAPCRTSNWGYAKQGSCQAGFSAAISKDGRRLFIGAPGSWYWQGQMYSIDANAKFPFTTDLFSTFGSGQVIRHTLENRPAVIQTREGSAVDDDSYLGYSMAVGDFNNEGYQGIAAGMPKGDELRGKVVLYTWNLTNFKNITGTQLGSYFGYAIAAGDVDGDGLDDLIIGAPLFTLPNNEAKYEVGRVYVIYQQSSEGHFRRIHELDGYNSKSRFGLSVASLGDINLDGYGDFAVGAPYDGPNELGAVYVYHGSANGVRKKFAQKITSEEMSGRYGRPIATFGFSIAGGVDLDDNDYPDTVVGAYSSNSVFYLRSRPVARIDCKVEFLLPKKEIILDQKNCSLNGVMVPCTDFEVCFDYKGTGVPPTIILNVEYILDAKKGSSRMLFHDYPNIRSMNETFDLNKDNFDKHRNCRIKKVYVKNEIRDKLSPMEVEVRYSMEHRRYYDRGQLVPILDLTEPPIKNDSIVVYKNCGSDNICVPDLSLIVKPNFERYLFGSKEKLEFDVIVKNTGEDSFETTYSLQIPEGVDYNKAIEVGQNAVRISCTGGENNTVNCDVGNPLPARTIAHFKIELKPYHKEGMKNSYNFLMVANSTNPEREETFRDNKLALSIPIFVNSTLFIHGKSKPSEVRYNMTNYSSKETKNETDIGPQVIHVYNIKNEGPSTSNETEILFMWPAATETGDDLMYLIEEPQVQGNIICESANANHRGYTLDRHKKTIWEALETEQVKIDSSGESKTTRTGTSESKSTNTRTIVTDSGKTTISSTSTSSTSSSGNKIGIHGVKVEEGPVVFGHLPERKPVSADVDKSGDASFVHQDRQQKVYEESRQGFGTGHRKVYVTEDKDDGGTIRTITTSINETTPVVTTNTFYKNTTTYYGPDGRVVKQEVSSGELPSKGNQYGGVEDRYYSQHNQSHHGGLYTGGGSYGSSTSRGQHFGTAGSRRYNEESYGGGYSNQHKATTYGSSGSRVQDPDDIKPNIVDNIYASEEYTGDPALDFEANRHKSQSQEHTYSGQSGYGYGTQSQGARHPSTYGHRNTNFEKDYSEHGLGAAALDHGLKTGGFDLGVLNAKSVDETVSKPAGQHYDPDLGWIAQSGSSGQQTGHRSGGGRQWSQQTRWSAGDSLERDNVATDTPNYRARHLGRKKRDVFDINAEDVKDVVDCKPGECRMVKCVAGVLRKDEDVTVGLRWRVNVRTLQNISSSQPIKFATMALARISKVPYIGSLLNKTVFKHEIVTTVIPPEPDVLPSVVPLWVVVLSAVAGVIILLLLAFLLYKCGFFKRNRVSDAPERQPLNKNGHYYNGDEAL